MEPNWKEISLQSPQLVANGLGLCGIPDDLPGVIGTLETIPRDALSPANEEAVEPRRSSVSCAFPLVFFHDLFLVWAHLLWLVS